MSNHSMYKAYANYTRQPVLTDGTTFAQMMLAKRRDPDMFEAYMRTNVRYYVPRFSFENAMAKLTQEQRDIVDDALYGLSRKHYDLFNPANDLPISDEECRFVNCALDFKEKMPTMVMQVASPRIWQLYYTALAQKKKDSDLL